MTRSEALAQLDPCGEAGARAMAARVRAEVPGAVDGLIRPLLAAGLIEGWRNVVGVNLPDELPGLIQIRGPFLTGRESCKSEKST